MGNLPAAADALCCHGDDHRASSPAFEYGHIAYRTDIGMPTAERHQVQK
jgi:hypothetical protein